MIVIINYGMGNVGSIRNMIRKFTKDVIISSEIKDIENAEKLILPGVGSFDAGMKNLHHLNIIDLLNRRVLEDKIPVLGICLGMQLLSSRSEEGTQEGLNWISGETIKFRFKENNNNLKIPHMGWNYVKKIRESELLENMYSESRFYFVHSYHVVCENEEDVILKTLYGIEFTSALQRNNIFGVQFHPEKSHKYGLQLLKNFIEYKVNNG
ncbi:MAG: imidazole glycerol phosphate synthase subunit HisH [Ignavibacteriae bacterium]|nr:imidazole glycerol phosphate synthase subunit HisH [Ignavibacteriota bacterium]